MAATIDKGSIVATATLDPKVFKIGFDFTDEVVIPAEGWKVTWRHAEFLYNTQMTATERNTVAQAAMARARKPDAETVVETSLKSVFGVAVVRNNPNIPETYQKVEIAAITDGVIVSTRETV